MLPASLCNLVLSVCECVCVCVGGGGGGGGGGVIVERVYHIYTLYCNKDIV